MISWVVGRPCSEGALQDAGRMQFERRVTESTCRSSGYRRLQIYFGFLIGTPNC
jgi:hypothetical protein